MIVQLRLTDEEAGFLYGLLYRNTQEISFRRRRRAVSESEKLAQKIALQVRAKTRKALPKGAARAIEVMHAGLI